MFKLINFNRALTDEARGLEKYGNALASLSLSSPRHLTLLPEHQDLKALAALYEKVLFDGQIIPICYIPDDHYVTDETIFKSSALISQIDAHLDRLVPAGEQVALFMAKPNPYLYGWLLQLKRKVHFKRETQKYLKQIIHKGIFHRHISTKDTPSVIEAFPALRIPLGYIAGSKKDIKLAYTTLKTQGVEKIMAKPIKESLGRGIKTLHSVADIHALPKGVYAIEEKLALDTNSFGMEANCAIGYHQQKPFAHWTQLIDGTTYVGAVYPFEGSEAVKNDIANQSAIFLEFAKTYGMKNDGGIDFLIANDKAYLIDNNLGRLTATHSSIFFQQNHAINRPFSTFAIKNHQYSVDEVWEILQKADVAFDKTTKTGVFPYAYMKGETRKFIAFHDSSTTAYEMGLKVQSLFD